MRGRNDSADCMAHDPAHARIVKPKVCLRQNGRGPCPKALLTSYGSRVVKRDPKIQIYFSFELMFTKDIYF